MKLSISLLYSFLIISSLLKAADTLCDYPEYDIVEVEQYTNNVCNYTNAYPAGDVFQNSNCPAFREFWIKYTPGGASGCPDPKINWTVYAYNKTFVAPTCEAPEIWDVETSECICGTTKTDAECVAETGNPLSTWFSEACTCSTPCPPPEGSENLLNLGIIPLDICQQDYVPYALELGYDNPFCYGCDTGEDVFLYAGAFICNENEDHVIDDNPLNTQLIDWGYNGLATCQAFIPPCNPETELLNENNECILKSSLISSDFADLNSTLGSIKFGDVVLSQENCIAGTIENYSIGSVQLLGWDYDTNKCKYVSFSCNDGLSYSTDLKLCEIPPDNISFGDNICENDNWAKRTYLDYCGKCDGLYIFTPPIGHEELECNKAYYEYACVKDYRINKYVEVSCGEIETTNVTELNISSISDTEFEDINISNLDAIDPTEASLSNVEALEGIEDAISKNLSPLIKSTNNKLDVTNGKLDGITDIMTDMKGSLNGLEDGVGNVTNAVRTSNSILNDIKDSVDGDFDGFDTSTLDTSSIEDTSIFDNLEENFLDMTNGVTAIKDDYDTLTTLLNGETPVVEISSGSCSDENFIKFGTYLSPYAPIISLVVYINMMILIFKMIFSYFRGGN